MKMEQLADNVTLFCGDSREIIPGIKGVDTVISDPPYGIEKLVTGYGRSMIALGAGTKVRAKVVIDKAISNDKDLEVVSEVFAALRSQLKNAWLASFYSCRITPEFLGMMQAKGFVDYFGEMIWDKKTPGLGTQIRYQHENVAFYRIGKPSPLQDVMSVITYAALKGESRTGEGRHPHEKPDQVMDSIVRAVPGRLILDPFMGTGSTGAAAVRAKRGFVGIELEPKYFEIALKKVGAAIKQPVAFWE